MTPWIPLILLLPACAETLIPEAEPLPEGSMEDAVNVAVPGPTSDAPPSLDVAFEVEEGSVIQISGEAVYDGEADGGVLLQFLRETDGEPVELLHSEKLSGPGAFRVAAPVNLGTISVVAILDRDQDGLPTVHDLGGRSDLEAGSQDIASVRIQIGDIASLGSLTPGQLMPGTGTIDGPMIQMEDHPATVEPPPVEEETGPQAPNTNRDLDAPSLGNTPTTEHPPVGGVEPPPDSIHARQPADREAK